MCVCLSVRVSVGGWVRVRASLGVCVCVFAGFLCAMGEVVPKMLVGGQESEG